MKDVKPAPKATPRPHQSADHTAKPTAKPATQSPGQSLQWLPTSRVEMQNRGWDELDILLITGDAYIDHPSFGTSLLGRILESKGYKVGIIAQPDWRSPKDIEVMGRPKLFCGVSA